MESSPFETLSLTIISIYTFFTLFWLTNAEFTADGSSVVSDILLSQIDRVFLIIFFTEIALKVFASNFMYLHDAFNQFDTFMVSISLLLNLLG